MNAEPQEFRFSIGGHFRPSYTVEGKQGEKVRYRARTSSGRETEQELTPTTRQWLEFWKAVAQIKNWKERYGNSAVCDGTSWIVEIKTEGRTFRSSGLNAYPPRFKTFLRHVKNFVGGLAFA